MVAAVEPVDSCGIDSGGGCLQAPVAQPEQKCLRRPRKPPPPPPSPPPPPPPKPPAGSPASPPNAPGSSLNAASALPACSLKPPLLAPACSLKLPSVSGASSWIVGVWRDANRLARSQPGSGARTSRGYSPIMSSRAVQSSAQQYWESERHAVLLVQVFSHTRHVKRPFPRSCSTGIATYLIPTPFTTGHFLQRATHAPFILLPPAGTFFQ
mmetsp:Transcript_49824/g.112047  ORF Transcript_49824/g.112047 Transcript_49824/m.112047 type:complete len:211 (+) Transcript_49824:568-1200(+)